MKVQWVVLCGLVFVVLPQSLFAVRIDQLSDISVAEQLVRFLRMQDDVVRNVLFGSGLVGVCCGLLGAFLMVRRLAMLSDALSHAVLPGVVLGYLWSGEKDPLAIFICATLVAFLGACTIQLLRQTTKHKEDAALGFVLSAFFGVGICLLSMVQNLSPLNVSGLNNFLFGQAAALLFEDIVLLCFVTLLSVSAVVFLYKEFMLVSFDLEFARTLGLPVRFLHYGLILLLAFTIVASLQAVGVVLVSAMLVIPAATAYLLTDRFLWMLVLSALLGMISSVLGVFVSFLGGSLPTGPVSVLVASTLFLLALLLAPRNGVLTRLRKKYLDAAQIRNENMLKEIYRILENEEFRRDSVRADELAMFRKETTLNTQRGIRSLLKAGLVKCSGEAVSLTPKGWERASQIVRNHRLWELYLNKAANIAVDHVHEDAERIEHVLGEDMVMKLSQRLQNARMDPHGKEIPLPEQMAEVMGRRQAGGSCGGESKNQF